MIKLLIKYDEEFLVETLRRARSTKGIRRLRLGYQVGALLISISFGTVLFYNGARFTGIALMSFGLIVLFTSRIDEWTTRRNLRQSPYCNDEIAVTITDEGYQAKSSIQDVTFAWSVFTKAVQFNDGLLLFQGPRLFNWLPYSAIQEGTVEELEGFVRARIETNL